MKKQTNTKGFTLVELMVVMALMAVLATLILGAIQLARGTATETIHRSNAKAVQTALESNFAKNKRYCGTDSTSPARQNGELDCATTYSVAGAYALMSNSALTNMGSTAGASGAQCLSTAPAVTFGGAEASGGYITRADTYDDLGGGAVTVSTEGYYIKVANSGCTAFNGSNDDIKGGATQPTAPNFSS